MQAHDTDFLIFDSDCVFCSGFARFVARHDREGRFRFASAASPLGRDHYRRLGLDPDAMETNIVVIAGKGHIKMASFAAVMRALGWPWKALAAAAWLPSPVGDRVYDAFARSRYRFGRCPVPSGVLRERMIG